MMKPIRIAFLNCCVIGIAVTLQACSSTSTNDEDPSGIIDDDVTTTPTLSIDNYTGMVGYALQFYATRTLPGPAFTGPAPQDFSQPQSTDTDPDTGLETAVFTCSNGGTATRSGRASDSDLFEFDNCQNGESLLNGQLGYEVGKYSFNREFNNFTADINGGTTIHTVAAGEINNYSGNACGNQQRTRSVAQYTIAQGEQLFELKDWNTTLTQAQPAPPLCDTSTLEIDGQYSVRSADTDNKWLLVNVTQSITGTAFTPTAGVVSITAGDASTIAINFATGDNSTVAVTITNGNGETTFEEPLTSWSDSLLSSSLSQR